MKKSIAGIMCVLVLCCTGAAFGSGRDHGRGHSEHHGGRYKNGHGNNHHGHHDNYHHGYRHCGWGYGFYTPAVMVVTPGYYQPVVQCRYIDVYDAWGNFRGQERICD